MGFMSHPVPARPVEFAYPNTRRDDTVDIYHGEAVADPYRWLEDTCDEKTRAWVAAQNVLTESFLADVASREAIGAKLTERWDHAKFGVPFERGGRWFQTRNSGLQNQPVVHVMEDPEDEGYVLLDPNTLSFDGSVAVSAISVSRDGSKMAYATSRSGSDWLTWHVRDVSSRSDLGDALHWSKSTDAEWQSGGGGFYYSAAPPPRPGREHLDESRDERVFLHLIGTSQQEDELVFAPDGPGLWPMVDLSPDGRYLVVSVIAGTGPEVEVLVLDLANKQTGLRTLLPAGSVKAVVVANEDDTFYVLTDDHADTGRVVAIELGAVDRSSWREVVPPREDPLLEAHFFGGRLVCHYLRDACSALRVFELDGTFVREICLPAMTTLAGSRSDHELIEGRPDRDLIYFELVSFTQSSSLWSHDLGSGLTKLVRPAACSLDPERYVTEQVHVSSPDGTQVPLFLTYRRGLTPDGELAVLLHGYGGHGICVTPSFSVPWAVWLERGGMLAVASLRGGGEHGRSWHEAGRRANKQNVFDDFLACAEWLTTSGWSRPARIAVNGRSNGGLLVGACLTQRPALFGAAVAEAGVYDLLRFHRFTVGWAWKPEHGDPEDPEQYRWLRALSPLHNVRAEVYPATLLTTGDHDDRVVPGHSFKFAATLQASQHGDAPVLLRVDSATGHGSGKPTAKSLEEATDILTFLEAALGWEPTSIVPGISSPGEGT